MHALAHGTVQIFVDRPSDGVINHIKTCFAELHMVASKQNQYNIQFPSHWSQYISHMCPVLHKNTGPHTYAHILLHSVHLN